MRSPGRPASSYAVGAKTDSSASTSLAKLRVAPPEREQRTEAGVFPQVKTTRCEISLPRSFRYEESIMSLRFRRGARLALSGLTACTLASCTSVGQPASAQSAGAPISAAEAQQGSQYHQQFLNEFGGAMTGAQATYVEQVGKNIAVQSGLAKSQAAVSVPLLTSSVDNASAVPGGYVYVTRQLVSLMNNEAELAGVLGHEVGHVAARHSASRQQRAQRNSILGAIGSIL